MSKTQLFKFEPKDVFLGLPTTQRGRPVVLGGDPKGKNFLYAHDNYIVCRDIANPLKGFTYTEHPRPTTVAKYAPSGFYICSADVTGKVRIWDTTQAEHMLKYEYQCLGGPIKDLAWSEDSKRIVVCGEGSDVCARAFLWDSGSSVGEISGHSKPINAIDFKQNRPYRVCTASEDTDVGFYAGPPFKRSHLNHEHDKFVNAVRYAPDGSLFLSGDAGGKAYLFDGKDGKLKAELGGGKAHEGGIYGVSWSPDSKRAITASADKTVKLWDVEANTAITTFKLGTTVDDQQLGCLWQGEYMLSVSLSGHINYLDASNPDKPLRILKGMQESITTAVADPEAKVFYAGGNNGRVIETSFETGDSKVYAAQPKAKISGMTLAGGKLITTSFDDTVRTSETGSDSLSADAVKPDSQPRGACVVGDATVVACSSHVSVIQGGKQASSLAIDYEALCIAGSAGGDIAVGGADKKIRIYTLSGSALTEKTVVDAKGSVHTLAYSPDGNHLASGDSGRQIYVFNKAYEKVIDGEWIYHSAKVQCVAWSPDNKHLVSGGLDTNVIVWNLDHKSKKTVIKGAHPSSNIVSVGFVSETEIFAAGEKSTVRTWTITPVA